jgi:hypothetical protein
MRKDDFQRKISANQRNHRLSCCSTRLSRQVSATKANMHMHFSHRNLHSSFHGRIRIQGPNILAFVLTHQRIDFACWGFGATEQDSSSKLKRFESKSIRGWNRPIHAKEEEPEIRKGVKQHSSLWLNLPEFSEKRRMAWNNTYWYVPTYSQSIRHDDSDISYLKHSIKYCDWFVMLLLERWPFVDETSLRLFNPTNSALKADRNC